MLDVVNKLPPLRPFPFFKRIAEPEARLRWLLEFGAADLDRLSLKQRDALLQQLRAFLLRQQTEPARRRLLGVWPPPKEETPNTLSREGVRLAQQWLKRGLKALRDAELWSFSPHASYEIRRYSGLLWVRMRGRSPLEEYKAAVYETVREARFRVRFCPECSTPFVPVRRQAYCSTHCSQAVRTRKWRKAHPEQNREIRRNQYLRQRRENLNLSSAASIKIGRRPAPRSNEY